MIERRALIIFGKRPEEGRVKTRIASTEGEKTALDFYTNCVTYITAEAEKLRIAGTRVFFFYETGPGEQIVRQWIGYPFQFVPQSDGDLGKKMEEAFRIVFDGGFDKVVIIGTDVPDMNSAYIKKAFEKLTDYDIVAGPSSDGGYNLLGLNKHEPSLFRNIIWSSEEVLEKTTEIAASLHLNTNLLDQLSDIDTGPELRAWLKSEKGNKELKSSLLNILLRHTG